MNALFGQRTGNKMTTHAVTDDYMRSTMPAPPLFVKGAQIINPCRKVIDMPDMWMRTAPA
ncbi:MAG: hypothetical protein Pars92KO_18430 [Parasphingorhabdus sp.]